MRHTHTRDGVAGLAVVVLIVLEAIALRLSPARDWPLVTVVLVAALAGIAVVIALGARRRGRG
ncbi:hypothetical protein I5Q34_09420 [Streptomyces sp. AV19]|uniref:hypothetical protein n=1 Tax=Streptomyces sp. AV19 TaxID=2793068 RepID=UPI0018FEBFED|nr:hypothetical protein [Streptomyces sp. AV19]MBH1934503.1 hypothetical protein [Streptomyces sp. AV19]MDG4533297.1 hypothetical protein [Streptomyces sp. AV19]